MKSRIHFHWLSRGEKKYLNEKLFVPGHRIGIHPHRVHSSTGSWELPSRSTSSSSCCWFSPAWYHCPKKTTAVLYLTTLQDRSILCCATLMDLLQLNTLARTHKYWPTGLLPKVTLEALGVGDHTATVQNVLIRVFIKFILFTLRKAILLRTF